MTTDTAKLPHAAADENDHARNRSSLRMQIDGHKIELNFVQEHHREVQGIIRTALIDVFLRNQALTERAA